MIRVAIAGGFDPFHEGHYNHLMKASQLGDYLVVMVSNDADMIRKKGKCNIPLWFRILTVHTFMFWEGIRGAVIETLDVDGTQAETLKVVKPDIFAKGGDRTPDNMPRNELRVCEQIGCRIAYGVGNLLNSSSEMEVV